MSWNLKAVGSIPEVRAALALKGTSECPPAILEAINGLLDRAAQAPTRADLDLKVIVSSSGHFWDGVGSGTLSVEVLHQPARAP